jgi:hypothetical protein
MIKISHRGNLHGPNLNDENNPDYIYEAIKSGYNVEIDFWVVDRNLYFGHEEPTYKVNDYFLHYNIKNIWLHCKNLEALDFVLTVPKYYKAFWHQEDSYTITTNNYIWTYPGMPVTDKSILVHKDMPTKDVLSLNMAGICSDYIGKI